MVPNALSLIAPYVTHLGHSNFGFCLCVLREGNGKKPTEEETTRWEAQVAIATVAVSIPVGHKICKRGQGTKGPTPVYLFSPFNYPVTWLNCGLDELILSVALT